MGRMKLEEGADHIVILLTDAWFASDQALFTLSGQPQRTPTTDTTDNALCIRLPPRT